MASFAGSSLLCVEVLGGEIDVVIEDPHLATGVFPFLVVPPGSHPRPKGGAGCISPPTLHFRHPQSAD